MTHRSDDTTEKFKDRLAVYHEVTSEVLSFFQSSLFRIKVPESGMSPDEIYLQAQEKLKEIYPSEQPVTIDNVTPMVSNEPPTAAKEPVVNGSSNENQPQDVTTSTVNTSTASVDNKCFCLIS